jgi:hypothetical protein
MISWNIWCSFSKAIALENITPLQYPRVASKLKDKMFFHSFVFLEIGALAHN